MKKTGLTPKLIKSEYTDVENAIILEGETANKYKKDGWFLLNTNKTGGIGCGQRIWFYESCKNESLKHKTRSQFNKAAVGAYNVSRKNNWLDEFYPYPDDYIHKKPKYYWKNKDVCREKALLCKNRRQFLLDYPNAYNQSLKNNWLDEFLPYKEGNKKPNGFWTFEKCKEESSKYFNKSEFKKHSYSTYQSAFKNKWLNDITLHMKSNKPKNYWNYETAKIESSKFKTKGEFRAKSSSAYNFTCLNKWLDEFFPKPSSK